jgi:CDP-diglyceride synthetase
VLSAIDDGSDVVAAAASSEALDEEAKTTDDAAKTIPPLTSPGSKTFTVEFPVDIATPSDDAASKQIAKVDTSKAALKKKADGGKPRRSILFGAIMGALVAGWVFSGNYAFTGLFTLMTILGQLEYYRMVMNTGVYPARRISVVGACSMFITALFAPDLHQLCLPFFALLSMGWFLTMRKQTTSIPEISTTFTGMFLLGYIPSFWVLIRTIGSDVPPTRLAKLAEPVLAFLGQKADALPSFLPKFVHLPITTGAVFIFWTWLSIAFSDVGAYFVGRSYGKTKLGDVAPAAGAASPNKTVEGVMGGCAISAILATLGAWVQRWPYWYITGPIHGIYLGALGLLGDLTASMIKRDADIKDFGDLIPEHGGVMDRVDSYIFAAPYSFVMCKYVIPLMTKWKSAGLDTASAGLVGLLSVPLVWFFSLRKILQLREIQHSKRRMEEESL